MEEKGVTQYKSGDGQMIKLSFDIIKRYLVSGKANLVTTQEMVFYMGVCKSRALNPFIGDCYLIKYTERERAGIIVSIDYYRKRARSKPDCQGWKNGIVVKNIEGDIELREGCIKLEEEELLGGWYEATPKGWTVPMKKIVGLERYIKKTREGKITQFWQPNNQPEMIAKVAESQGLRATWPDEFQGIYTDAERESMDAQAGFDATIQQQAKQEERKAKMDQALKPSAEPAPEPKPEPVADPVEPAKEPKQQPEAAELQGQIDAAENELRSHALYKHFDPLKEPIGERYHAAKVQKLKDLLTRFEVEFYHSWPGAKLHEVLLANYTVSEPEPDPPPPAAESDDPMTFLALQSDLARMRAQEPEISMAAIENQRQQGRIRDGVKIADLTLEELQAVLADIYDQVNLRANMNA